MVLLLGACDGGSSSTEAETDGGSSSGTTEPSSTSGTVPPTSAPDPATTTTSPTSGGTTTVSDDSGTTTAPDTDTSVDTDTDTDSDGPVEQTVPVVVAVGAAHARYVSLDDGLTWCATGRTDDPAGQSFDTPFLLRNVSYGHGMFIAGSWRAIFVSENGLEWEDITGDENPAFGQWTGQIQYGNGWWVATGGYGTAMRSEDLVSWEVTSSGMPGTEASRTLAFGNGMFVSGRDNVGWFSSADGAQWSSMNPEGDSRVIFDGDDFAPHPGYDESDTGTRMRVAWPDGIERAVGEGSYERVATTADSITRFAFGLTTDASIMAAPVAPEVADCLGL